MRSRTWSDILAGEATGSDFFVTLSSHVVSVRSDYIERWRASTLIRSEASQLGQIWRLRYDLLEHAGLLHKMLGPEVKLSEEPKPFGGSLASKPRSREQKGQARKTQGYVSGTDRGRVRAAQSWGFDKSIRIRRSLP